jgi:hypothetical protein
MAGVQVRAGYRARVLAVQNSVESLVAMLLEGEAGQRGFLIAGESDVRGAHTVGVRSRRVPGPPAALARTGERQATGRIRVSIATPCTICRQYTAGPPRTAPVGNSVSPLTEFPS